MTAARFSVRRVLALVGIVLAIGLSVLAARHWWTTRPLPFDRAVWNSKPSGLDDFRRHRMADELVEQRSLIGLSRDQVLAMLGEPTKTSHFRDFDLVYVLGDERGWISIDSEWLVMRLDADGHVSTAELVRD